MDNNEEFTNYHTDNNAENSLNNVKQLENKDVKSRKNKEIENPKDNKVKEKI